MSSDSKVLTGFLERRALAAAFAELATLTDPSQVAARADEIAAHGPAAIAALLTALDTEDAQLRGNLGQVVKRLDRDAVIAALRGVARGPGYDDRARVTALTLLERFLDVPVDETLLAGLQNPDAVAQQSLRELILAMDREPAAILEYLSQLAQQPPDVAQMVLDAVPLMPPNPHLVSLLRMLAQGENRAWAHEAIAQLGRLRMPEARAALTTLAACLPPALAALAERGARKLMLSGVREVDTPSAEGVTWRALVSPVDGFGTQLIWFVRQDADQETGTLLAVLCGDPEGIVGSSGLASAPQTALPPVQPLGSIYYHQPAAGWSSIPLLETPWAVGRETVQRALARHWAAGTVPPVEFRWLNPLIWAPKVPDVAVVNPAPGAHTPAEIAALLDHPAFSGWLWHNEAVSAASRRLGWRPNAASRAEQITRLATTQLGPDVRASYQRRLTAMAQWLALAGQSEAATLAASAAAHLAEASPAQSPFIRRLIGAGLDAAAINLRLQAGARRA